MAGTDKPRRAKRADSDAITRIVRAAYDVYVPRIGREPAPMSVDYAAAVNVARVWLVGPVGHPVGVLVTRELPDHLLIENIAVAPSAQRLGIGGRLLDRAEEDAREAGLLELRLYTNAAMTENLRFYPRHGFVETHRATEDGFDRVFFTKKLDGDLLAQQETRPPH